MSTSLLYYAFGVRGHQEVALDFEPRTICFRVEQDPDTFRCSCCASSNVHKSGVVPLVPPRFRTVPIGRKQVFIELPIQRVLCFDCCKTRQVKFGFADPRFGYTRSFERYALDLSRRTTIRCPVPLNWCHRRARIPWLLLFSKAMHRPLARPGTTVTCQRLPAKIQSLTSHANPDQFQPALVAVDEGGH